MALSEEKEGREADELLLLLRMRNMIRPPPPPPPPFSPPFPPSAWTRPWNSREEASTRILPPLPPPLVSDVATTPFADSTDLDSSLTVLPFKTMMPPPLPPL